MATFYMDNHTASERTVPAGKFPKGEMTGKKRVLIDRKTLVDAAGTAGLDSGDVIYGPKIPADSIVTNVRAAIDKSLGATGIFSVGFLANGVDSADADAFILAVDGGGQSALEIMPTGSAGLFKRFSVETQLVLTLTEVMDDSVLDAIATLEVEYVND